MSPQATLAYVANGGKADAELFGERRRGVGCRACRLPTSVCCGAIPVPVSKADMVRLEGLADLVENGRLPKRGGQCVFLMDDQSCGIYERRPQACRDQDSTTCVRGGFGG